MSQKHDFQKAIRQYKRETGKTEVEMIEVARYAVGKLGYKLPQPTNPLEALAKKFATAAREETRTDKNTGLPYRANHAVPREGKQYPIWVDIDEAPRPLIQKSFQKRREAIVGDTYQLSLDIDHWNSANSSEEPIVIPMDFTEDVEEKKLATLKQNQDDDVA